MSRRRVIDGGDSPITPPRRGGISKGGPERSVGTIHARFKTQTNPYPEVVRRDAEWILTAPQDLSVGPANLVETRAVVFFTRSGRSPTTSRGVGRGHGGSLPPTASVTPVAEIFKAERSGGLLMVKKKGRGRFRRYLRGNIDHKLALTTLAAVTAAGSVLGDSVTESAYLTSLKARWSLGEFTAGAGIGPILVGVAHSDYSISEIEAWIENTGSWEVGDKVQSREIGKRFIRRVGVFQTPLGDTQDMVLNDGKPIHTKCGWGLATGQTLRIWAYNMGSAAIATTVPNVRVQGHANLWPR